MAKDTVKPTPGPRVIDLASVQTANVAIVCSAITVDADGYIVSATPAERLKAVEMGDGRVSVEKP